MPARRVAGNTASTAGHWRRQSARRCSNAAVAPACGSATTCSGCSSGGRSLPNRRSRCRRSAAPRRPPPSSAGGSAAALYRPCPECGKLMHRRNYGRKSGVILDTCAAHGIWFDLGELDRVLGWVHGGGRRRADEATEVERRHRERDAAHGAARAPVRPFPGPGRRSRRPHRPHPRVPVAGSPLPEEPSTRDETPGRRRGGDRRGAWRTSAERRSAPDRRSGGERRSGRDRRSQEDRRDAPRSLGRERRKGGERRSGLDRRRG